jgi:hypothetical protein
LRCGEDSGDGERLLKELILSKIAGKKTLENWTDAVKNIISTFSRHVLRKIPTWSITEDARLRLEAFVFGKTSSKRSKELVNEIIADMKENLRFDRDARLFMRAIKADVEFLECLQVGARTGPYLIDDITGVDVQYRRVLELEDDLNYIMLDQYDNACAFVQKPGPELLAKITQHEAETFMSKHGLRADMEAMRADMRKDYGDLMHKVTSEAASLGLRL